MTARISLILGKTGAHRAPLQLRRRFLICWTAGARRSASAAARSLKKTERRYSLYTDIAICLKPYLKSYNAFSKTFEAKAGSPNSTSKRL